MLLLTSYLIPLCLEFFIFKARMMLAIAPWRAVVGKSEVVNRFKALRTTTETNGLELVVYLLTLYGVWELKSPGERDRDQAEGTGPDMDLKDGQNGRKL